MVGTNVELYVLSATLFLHACTLPIMAVESGKSPQPPGMLETLYVYIVEIIYIEIMNECFCSIMNFLKNQFLYLY